MDRIPNKHFTVLEVTNRDFLFPDLGIFIVLSMSDNSCLILLHLLYILFHLFTSTNSYNANVNVLIKT